MNGKGKAVILILGVVVLFLAVLQLMYIKIALRETRDYERLQAETGSGFSDQLDSLHLSIDKLHTIYRSGVCYRGCIEGWRTEAEPRYIKVPITVRYVKLCEYYGYKADTGGLRIAIGVKEK
jgi:hypothetical protein